MSLRTGNLKWKEQKSPLFIVGSEKCYGISGTPKKLCFPMGDECWSFATFHFRTQNVIVFHICAQVIYFHFVNPFFRIFFKYEKDLSLLYFEIL